MTTCRIAAFALVSLALFGCGANQDKVSTIGGNEVPATLDCEEDEAIGIDTTTHSLACIPFPL